MSRPSVTPKRVSADWARAFTGFDAWRPMRLLRRIGPVVQGITLDRSTTGDAYFPTTHVHALTRDFPVIALTMGQRLLAGSGVQERILFSCHEEEFASAVRRLAEQSLLSLSDPPEAIDVVRAQHAFAVAQQEKGRPPAFFELEDGVLVAAVVGEPDLVTAGLEIARDLLGKWPKSALPPGWISGAAWLDDLSERARDVDALLGVVERQIAFHGLSKVREFH